MGAASASSHAPPRAALAGALDPAAATALPVQSETYGSAAFFIDPSSNVLTKEFALFHNTVPDPSQGPGGTRKLFHLIYQRSHGPQAAETLFGHAWSGDLSHWVVDTSAFTVDATSWNSLHVWSPSIVRFGSKDLLFYTGVDAQGDQRLGYASTSLLDTTNTVWDPARVMVWQASNTNWAVPDPSTYSGQSQFRDAFVMADPADPTRLLMFYEAHDSITFRNNELGLTCGVARSASGSADVWEDLGFYASTLKRITHIPQFEGPHVFPVDGSGDRWRLMFSNGGSPPGEEGATTIQFEACAPGESPADTTQSHWGPPTVLMQYLNGDSTVWGWSGSEHLRVDGVDYLAGFTAWAEITGIAIARMQWSGNDFTLTGPLVTSVDEYRSAVRGVQLRLAGYSPRASRVTFLLDSPSVLEARLEVFDTTGRRVGSLLHGTIPSGQSSVSWDLDGPGGARVASGVYLARLSFAGGVRVVQLTVLR